MKKIAVITGASSGIGYAMAKILSNQGYGLVLVARREKRLQEIAKTLGNSQIFVADLLNEAECVRFEDFLKSIDFEIFINNAGFGDCGNFLESDLEKEKSMITLNIWTLHRFTKAVAQILERHGGGFILNVASSAGLLPGGPYMATYYATKAYVTSLSLAVAREFKEKQSPVSLSCLCPGPVNTEFNQVANVEFALPGISAEFCAAYALKQMFRRKTIIVPGFMMKLAVFFARFLPRKLLVAIAGRQQKKKIKKSNV